MAEPLDGEFFMWLLGTAVPRCEKSAAAAAGGGTTGLEGLLGEAAFVSAVASLAFCSCVRTLLWNSYLLFPLTQTSLPC